jgi:hypothetical protein
MQESSVITSCVVTFMVVAVIYLVTAWIAFTKSSVIRETQATAAWRWLAEVLAFPAVYLSRWIEAADALVPLMILNSVIWGAQRPCCWYSYCA